jgi:hypothetical protein
MSCRFVGIENVSCGGVNVSGLGAAFFCPSGEHVWDVVCSFHGCAWGVHEILDSLIKDV